MEYYIYVYLDPRKNGEYIYNDFVFKNEPFYIGKGKKDRYKKHIRIVKNGGYKENLKNNIIREILNEGLEPIIIKIKEGITSELALFLEMEAIRIIGRICLNNGPLTNITSGGQGVSGLKLTEEHKRKLSESKRGKVTVAMLKHLGGLHKKMIGNKLTLGIKFSDEIKNKMGRSHFVPVYQLDNNENIVGEFESIKNASICTKINKTCISKVLCGNGKTAGGFKWKYKEEIKNDRIKEEKSKQIPKNNYIGKSIYKMDLYDNILKEYFSVTEASNDNMISVGNISKNLTGKGITAGGFKWKYK